MNHEPHCMLFMNADATREVERNPSKSARGSIPPRPEHEKKFAPEHFWRGAGLTIVCVAEHAFLSCSLRKSEVVLMAPRS